MRRGPITALILLVAAMLAASATTAHARELDLRNLLCVGGAQSASEAMALPASQLECAGVRQAPRDPFVRTRVLIPEDFNPTGEAIYWQTDPSDFDNILVRFTYADGHRRLVDVDPQMASRSWFARTRFSVPVPDAGMQLAAIDTVMARPRTHATVFDARLIGRDEARSEHYVRSLLYALMCGLLIAPVIFDFFYSRALRFRFMIWHAAMTLGLLGFVISNSGLIFEIFPSTPLSLRFQLNTATLAMAIVAAVGFILSLLEENTLPRWLSRLTIGLTALMVATKLLSFIDVEALRIVSHTAFLASVLPLSLVVLAVITVALFRESRAAISLLLSFSGLIIGGIIVLATSLGWYAPPYHIDDFLNVAMVVMVLGSSAAVGDRFMVLRVERDRARLKAVKLGRMALSDPLTGLGNRRAFDAIERLERGQALLVADVDHCKAINDTHGHLVGDTVLRHLASLMRDSFDTIAGTTIFRLGGEEFAVIFACDNDEQLRAAAERLRKAVDVQAGENPLAIPHATISVGGALGQGQPRSRVFAQADAALYLAKQSGRNCSAIHRSEGRAMLVEGEEGANRA